MNIQRSAITVGGLLAGLSVCSLGLALADNLSVSRAVLTKLKLTEPKTVDHVEVERLTFPPGATSGLHLHPGPVVSYVLSGSVIVQIDDGKSETYVAGQAVYEPERAHITRFDNASRKKPAVVIATYLLAKADQEVILKLD